MTFLELYKEGLKKVIKPMLKSEGFFFDRNYIHKSENNFDFIANIQKSQYNSPIQVTYYINIGIEITDYTQIIKHRDTYKYDCFNRFNERIDFFLEDKNKFQYSIGVDFTNVTSIGNIQQIVKNETDNSNQVFLTTVQDILAVYENFFKIVDIEFLLRKYFIKHYTFSFFEYLISKMISLNNKENAIMYLNEYKEIEKNIIDENRQNKLINNPNYINTINNWINVLTSIISNCT
jgi:hypothetical protein